MWVDRTLENSLRVLDLILTVPTSLAVPLTGCCVPWLESRATYVVGGCANFQLGRLRRILDPRFELLRISSFFAPNDLDLHPDCTEPRTRRSCW